jgi:UDP-3-O-[3-hydroxymyristoyl] glucosamine N-acyltransferase
LCPPQLHDSNVEKAIAAGELTKVVIDDTEVIFYMILNHFFSEKLSEEIHESSYVESGAAINEGVTIGANSFVASSVKLEYGVRIGSNCTLRNCTVGAETTIQDGVRIGEDALGAVQKKNGEWVDRQSFGRVVVGRNVRIEANTVIYRGFLKDTILKNNIRVGSNCSIGNGVQIGEGTLIAFGVVICGSVSIGSNARIWGNSSMREGVNIGDKAVIGLGSVVLNDVRDGEVHVGNPSRRLE